jgi:hypothetical protein
MTAPLDGPLALVTRRITYFGWLRLCSPRRAKSQRNVFKILYTPFRARLDRVLIRLSLQEPVHGSPPNHNRVICDGISKETTRTKVSLY